MPRFLSTTINIIRKTEPEKHNSIIFLYDNAQSLNVTITKALSDILSDNLRAICLNNEAKLQN